MNKPYGSRHRIRLLEVQLADQTDRGDRYEAEAKEWRARYGAHLAAAETTTRAAIQEALKRERAIHFIAAARRDTAKDYAS